MLYAICYDVSDDARRGRVHEALKDFGRRVQYSVFECDVDEQGLRELMERIEFELDWATDSCRFYVLCGECRGKVKILGRGEPFSEAKYVIV